MAKGYSEYNQGGWHHTEEAKAKMSILAHNRAPISQETRDKMGNSHRGRHYHSEQHKKKMSQRMSGNGNPMYGKPNSLEAKAKISAKLKGRFAGDDNPMAGRFGSEHPNWKGGIAYLPYAPEFNNKLKEYIRERDGYICQECGVSQSECIYPLSPHHIDYDKMNCDEMNLISLCQSCHSKTNYNRGYWQNHFEGMIAKIYAQKEVMRSNA